MNHTVTVLRRYGMTNSDAEDFSDLGEVIPINREPKIECATFCSSQSCEVILPLSEGEIIHVGDHFLETCPHCHQSHYLYFTKVTKSKARELRKRLRKRIV